MIVVLGGSGTVGRELVVRLVATGLDVRATYRTRPLLFEGVHSAQVDLETGVGLQAVLHGARDLFLLTADGPFQERMQLRVLDAAVEAGVSRVVFLSVMGAETEAFTYARTHAATERALAASGLRYTVLRPNAFMQNFSTYYWPEIRWTDTFGLPCEDATISHVDARDIADVAAAVLGSSAHDGNTYVLTGPASLDFSQVAAILSRRTIRPVRYRHVDERVYRERLAVVGVPDDAIDRMLEQHRFSRLGWSSVVTSDVTRVTGRPPRSFQRFVDECWPPESCR